MSAFFYVVLLSFDLFCWLIAGDPECIQVFLPSMLDGSCTSSGLLDFGADCGLCTSFPGHRVLWRAESASVAVSALLKTQLVGL